jgi:hypothetical protein
MKKGYVYILVNPSVEGLVKIGKTSRSSESKAAEISRGTGVPTAYNVVCEEFVSDCDTVERRLHQTFDAYRVNPKKEFFKVPLKEAVRALHQVAAEFKGSEIPRGAEMLPQLQLKYAAYLKPEIKSVRMLQKEGLCFLEITSWVYSPNHNDEKVERVDLSFISEGMEREMFNPSRAESENAGKFINELDPYSIIMCTSLFTEEASQRIADEYENRGA